MAGSNQDRTAQPPTQYINLLPPGSGSGQMYSLLEILPPTAYEIYPQAIASYYLHLPKELNSVFSMNWEQKELGADILSGLIVGGNAGGGAGRDNSAFGMDTWYNFAADVGAAQGIGAGAVEAARRAAGTAKNPASTLLFQGVNLRNFQLTWDLMPTDAKTSSAYQTMISELRVRMHPRLSTNTAFSTPFLFRVQVIVQEKKVLVTMPCAMTNLTVNPMGSSLPAFHDDGTPVHTSLTIEMQELVQQTQQSIQRLYGNK